MTAIWSDVDGKEVESVAIANRSANYVQIKRDQESVYSAVARGRVDARGVMIMTLVSSDAAVDFDLTRLRAYSILGLCPSMMQSPSQTAPTCTPHGSRPAINGLVEA